MKRILLVVAGFTTFAAPTLAEATPFANGKYLNTELTNGKYLNGKYLNGKYLNTADMNSASGAATFYNPWTGQTLPNVYLDKSTFVSSDWYCDSDVQQCWQTEQRGDAFVGTWTSATLNDGTPSYTYIAGRWATGGDPDSYAYWVYSWAQDTSGNWNWLPTCADESGNIEPAIPLAGEWDMTTGARKSYAPGKFTWACTTGALGKCAASGLSNTLGYSPWKYNWYYTPAQSAAGYWYYAGVDGQRTHQACTRMIRADYCGDGQSHTYTGNPIDVRDYFYSGQEDVYDGEHGLGSWAAEAIWNENGARWLSCPRLAALPGGTLSCGNGHYLMNNAAQGNAMCFDSMYLPLPEELDEQQTGYYNLPAYDVDPGELLLGTRTANLWAQ